MPTTGRAGWGFFYACNTQSPSTLHRAFSISPAKERSGSRRLTRKGIPPGHRNPRTLRQDGYQSIRPLLHRQDGFQDGFWPTTKKALGQNEALIPRILKKLNQFVEKSENPKFLASVGLDRKPIQIARERCFEFVKQKQEQLKGWKKDENWTSPSMLEPLRDAAIRSGLDGLDAQLRLSLQGFVANYEFTLSDIKNQARVADLRFPSEWFPATRAMQRVIHLHVGPTNSGKTYHALKRLEQAETGIYAGPLRLLAHEVYSRLNARGKPCSLVTGDEQILTKSQSGRPAMVSCTVEMVPLNADVEVAVVDEIQLLGTTQRGWAWTQAVLGLKARELHLCGEERSVSIVKELAAATGDKLEIHRYKRLSPLKCMEKSLNGDFRQLRKGDCVVVFSRLTLHTIKKTIEKLTGKRVAAVYGSLPPEIRAQQARLFNDPDNDYDFLVATDAIGMGLNLSIKRIVFNTIYKAGSLGLSLLAIQDIKQIAGRAGRYRTAADDEREAKSTNLQDVASSSNKVLSTSFEPQNLGLVTTLEPDDLRFVRNAMQQEALPITSAGIFPPASILQRFATYFPPETPFSYILVRLHEIARMHPRFHLCDLRDQIGIADILHPIKELTIMDRIQFCAAPISMRDIPLKKAGIAYAECIAKQGGGDLLHIKAVNLDLLDVDGRQFRRESDLREYLHDLESLHKSLVLYLWLSYRFSGVFKSHALAFHVKRLVEEKIDEGLDGFSERQKDILSSRQRSEQEMLQDLQHNLSLEELPPGSKDLTNSTLKDQRTPQHLVALLDDHKIGVRPASTAA